MSSQSPATAAAAPLGRRTLNRHRVLRAALDYIDRHGPDGLTMRGLATDLGVEAMSLYKHVTSKDDLQAGVTELVWDEIVAAAPPDDDWPTWLRTYGHAIRDVIHRHPGTLALWFTQPIVPVPALELFDAQLQRCQPGRQADGANAIRAVGAFAIGYATSEVSWLATPTPQQPESDAQRIRRIARTLPADAPDRLIDTALLVCTGNTAQLFDTALDLMIKGLPHPEDRGIDHRQSGSVSSTRSQALRAAIRTGSQTGEYGGA